MGFLDNLLNRYTPRTPGKPVFAVIDTETTGFMRLPSSSGHPICADLVSVGEDVHCESTAQEIHAGVPA